MNEEKKKVLIAEDDEDILFVLEEGLEGFDIITAIDGLDALEKIRNDKPALIILDIMMPELNGADLNIELKNDPEFKDIPVIIITGRPNMRDIFSSSGQNRVASFLEKPFTIKVLKQEIERILNKQ
jgi:CheY-like chemotaxis protein